jgi:hypothetical protein
MTENVLILTVCLLAIGCSRQKADISAVELVSQFKDRKAADLQYTGRILTVSGTVYDVSYSWCTPAGYLTVAMKGTKAGEGVICHFPPESAFQAAKLLEGKTTLIRGTCRGELFEGLPYLDNCSVMR